MNQGKNHRKPLNDEALGNRELVQRWQFPHPGDHYLVMVLVLVGTKPAEGQADTREWATYYYNADCGGFNEGHYFPHNKESVAQRDFLERCLGYCKVG